VWLAQKRKLVMVFAIETCAAACACCSARITSSVL
jgi:hypothetical protein